MSFSRSGISSNAANSARSSSSTRPNRLNSSLASNPGSSVASSRLQARSTTSISSASIYRGREPINASKAPSERNGRILDSVSTKTPTPASSSLHSSPYARNGPLYTLACEPAHDRPVMCLSVSAKHNMIVSGSADHGLRVFSLDSGRFHRELFTRTSGHKEWVTTCSIMERDGRILSGGMDAAGCLWHAGTNVCSFFPGHSSSLTKVSSDDGNRVLTAAMDGTLQMWDCSGVDPVHLFTYEDHNRLPVTTFRWTRSLVVSADKGSASLMRKAGVHDNVGDSAGGELHVWDTETGSNVLTFAGHPGSTVLALSLLGSDTLDASTSFDPSFIPDIVVSGGTDGYIRVWDIRTGSAISSRRLSRGMPGAVTDICAWGYGAAQAERPADLIHAERTWRSRLNSEVESKYLDYDESRLSARDRLQAELQDNSSGSLSYGRNSGAGVQDLSILCALNDGFISVLDPRAGFKTRLALVGHRTPVLAVQACPDGEHVFSTSADGALLCHSMLQGEQKGSTHNDARRIVPSQSISQSRAGLHRQPISAGLGSGSSSGSGSGLGGLADIYAALGDSDGPSYSSLSSSSRSNPVSRATVRPAPSSSVVSESKTESTIPSRVASWGMCVSKGPTSEEARVVVGRGDGGRAVGCLAVGEGWAVTAGEDGTPLILGFADRGSRGNARAEWID